MRKGAVCMDRNSPIGFFDSGLGGISVLRETLRHLPGEDYLYFGDSLNAPYGVRPASEVAELTCAGAEHLLRQGCKALVLACNTATSAAAEILRQKYPDLPIIGTEPAIKPAVMGHPGGRILILATATTLKEQKFQQLWEQYRADAEIVPVPCSGLMEFVEQGILRGEELENFLMERLMPYMKVSVDAVVLGCTHYPFLRGAIRHLVGRKPEIIDSAEGVARQLRRQLESRDLLNARTSGGKVVFQNSLEGPEMLQLSEKLLQYEDVEE